ncbi:MAG TPA: phosphatase PAP2 family protein [Steroidobacteraceae bacterium]|nr:phosphatase PAP2 family protein [Steroidobacteraceae bacterium]
MKAGDFSTLLARIDAAEYGLCRCLNSGASRSYVRHLFRVVSRLGDGVAWYVLILALPFIYGRAAVRPAVTMALTGILGLAIYKWLKRTCVRKRPFITHPGIDCAAEPLDFYSFPSGHTLHAVCFTWQAVAHFGDLAWILVPFAGLIAASRVVLGLHYPSDVLVGAVLGALLAAIGLSLS